MSKIMEEYGEEIVFAGLTLEDADPDQYPATIITLNKRTGSWSRFMAPDSKHVCLMDIGVEGKITSSLRRNII
jgi:hypothetical protein